MTDYADAGAAIDLSGLSAVPGAAPPAARTVNYERILNARSEPQNWMTYYGTYDGHRYSQLDQVNTGNVRQLAPAWVFQFGSSGLHAGASTYAFEATPLVVDGTMFVSGWDGWVWALNAATGEQLWQFQTGSGHHSSPISYSVNGRQYIAAPVGWGGWVEGFAPGMLGGPHGDALFVFALPE